MSIARNLANLIGNIEAGGGGVNKNVIINGAMNVAQRATSATDKTASGYYTVDRWQFVHSNSDSTVTITQSTDTPTGFGNSTKLDCTAVDTDASSNGLIKFRQKIEGQNVQQFSKGTSGAKPFAVSFYVKGNASATYACELFDQENSRQMSQLFNVTTDWARVELTFPADTTGTLTFDNSSRFQIQFALHAGGNFTSGTLNSSAFASNTDANRYVGISSLVDSTSRTFFITGVQLEVGQNPTSFEHEPFERTLAKCQRYYQNAAKGANANELIADSHGHAENTTRVDFILNLHPNMRAAPTATKTANFIFRENGTNRDVTSITNSASASDRRLWIQGTTSGHTDEATGRMYTNGTNFGITMDAEL